MRRDPSDLKTGPFDVLVVGGGVYGSWMAFHAATAGLRVALIERDDWGGATSSASSKLLHGGLRYLEHYDFGLVRKSLQERRELTRLMPHQVWPLRFLLPIYKDSRVGRLKMKAGLWLYDRLAGSGQPVGPHRGFSARELTSEEPLLSDRGLVGGFSYGDCGTDDFRMVLEAVASAVDHGAAACHGVAAERLLTENGRVVGASVRDTENDEIFEITADLVVNAAGPWVNRLVDSAGPSEDSVDTAVRLTKGVHLVMPAMASKKAVLLTSRIDGRVFFLIPWQGRTLLGTTDTNYDGDPADVRATRQDADYLLKSANDYLREAWTLADVHGSYAGLRTLKDEAGKNPSAVSREWVFEETRPGLWSSVGGKYTSARVDARSAVQDVLKSLGRGTLPDEQPYPAWRPDGSFHDWLPQITEDAESAGVDAEAGVSLARRHGRRTPDVLGLIRERPDLAERIEPDLPFVRAEVVQAARSEAPRNLIDILRRRVPVLILARLDRPTIEDAAHLAAGAHGWNEARQASEVEAAAHFAARAIRFE